MEWRTSPQSLFQGWPHPGSGKLHSKHLSALFQVSSKADSTVDNWECPILLAVFSLNKEKRTRSLEENWRTWKNKAFTSRCRNWEKKKGCIFSSGYLSESLKKIMGKSSVYEILHWWPGTSRQASLPVKTWVINLTTKLRFFFKVKMATNQSIR